MSAQLHGAVQAMIWVSHPVETPFAWPWPFGPGAIIMATLK